LSTLGLCFSPAARVRGKKVGLTANPPLTKGSVAVASCSGVTDRP
jgi:hypothetical protein